MGLEITDKKAEKHGKYLELFGGEPDAIFVLSSDIVKADKEANEFGAKMYGDIAEVKGELPEWRSTAFKDLDPHGGICGGAFPVNAAAKAAHEFPNVPIVTTSRDRDVDASKGRPAHARVIAEELKRRGVDENRITLEEESVNSKTQMREILLIAAKNGWNKIAVVTNNFRVKRAKKMLEIMRNPGKKDLMGTKEDAELLQVLDGLKDLEVVFVSDEDILAGKDEDILAGKGDKSWKVVFDNMKQTPEYQRRMEMEMQGVEDLENGTYGTQK